MAMGAPPSARGKGKRAPMADINVTPLVDVMLVLLIIFMVTAPLLVTGVPVKLPDSRAKSLDADKKPTVVTIRGDGALFLDDKQLDEASLVTALDEIASIAGAEPPQIYLRADAKLDYGQVMRVMGELNRAGLNKVALVSSSSDEAASGR
ncbi:MAG: protein TolR [Sphingobium sp.]